MDKEQFLQNVYGKIARRLEKGKKTVVMRDIKIEDNTAKYVKKKLEEETTYHVEISKCMNCKGLWDIYIWMV